VWLDYQSEGRVMKKIKYLTSNRITGIPDSAEGYAVRLPHPFADFHCCIRRVDSGFWKADHFETGRNINSDYGQTKEQALVNLIEYLDKKGVKAVSARTKELGIPWEPSKLAKEQS
jgi:hypothetical protein